MSTLLVLFDSVTCKSAADPGFGEGRFVPSPSLPSHSPPLPFPSPPFPFLSLPRPYPFPPSPPLRSRTPCLRLGGLEERYKLPQRVRAEPGRQTLSGAFSAYLDAFLQAFSSNLSLGKVRLLTLPRNFS